MTTRHTTTTRQSRRAPRLLELIVLATSLFTLAIPAAPALALPADGNGNYTQILCADPASEDGLGISGMPEGLTNPATLDTWQISSTEVNCAAGRMTPGRGVPMAVGQTNSYPEGTWSALLYQAPASVSINAGNIYRAEKAEGANNGFMGIDQQGGEYDALYSLPRNPDDQGDWFAGGVASRGTFSWPFSPENLVNLTISPDAGHWDVNAMCDPAGNNNSSCSLTSSQWEYRIFGGEISLHAANDPQANNITGPLTSETPLRASETITLSATDQGPGLAYVKLLADGQSIQTQIIDTNNGRCVALPGHDPYTWAYQVPCKTSVGGRSYELNTALLPDGTHHVQVIIEDAAGNQSVVLDRTVTTNNAPTNTSAPAIITPVTPAPGVALASQPGAWSTPTGAGPASTTYQWQDCNNEGNNCQPIPGAQSPGYTPAASDVGHTLRVLVTATDNDGSNSAESLASSIVLATQNGLGSGSTFGAGTANGANASESAVLHVNGNHAISRPFARRALKLTGQLTNSQGHPIAGATLDILQQTQGANTTKLVKHVQTSITGTFTAALPAGPSRQIQVAYRAYTGDTSYTTTASVTETVRAGVHLHITTIIAGPNGTIFITGRVSGPIPHQGALVQILVHWRGHWELIRNPRTHPDGTFHVAYQFQGDIGRFPFWAEVPAGQASFPYTRGASNIVNVSTG